MARWRLYIGKGEATAPAAQPSPVLRQFSAVAQATLSGVVLAACAAPDYTRPTNHDLRLYPHRQIAVTSSGMGFSVGQQVVLLRDEEIRQPDTSSHRLFFGRGGAAPPPQRLELHARPSALAEVELEYRRSDHGLLHRYRVGFQTVGQPWLALQPPVAVRLEVEGFDQRRTDYTPLYGRTTPVAPPPAGAPWYLWQATRWTEPDQPEPARLDLGLLHRYRVGYQTVGQPWPAMRPPAAPELEAEGFTQHQTDYSPLYGRAAPAAPAAPGQPWFLLYPRPATLLEPEGYATPAISQAILYGRPAVEVTPPATPDTEPALFVGGAYQDSRPPDLLHQDDDEIALIVTAFMTIRGSRSWPR